MNIARSERRRAKHESVAANDDPWFAPISSSSVDAEIARAWMQKLPEVQRQIVTARIWGDLTFDQVAEIVERPTTTVFRLFREAIETLRLEMNISEQKRPLQSLNEGPIHE
jgi:RNA polymerase sigma-70 factor (ECF subfamily)